MNGSPFEIRNATRVKPVGLCIYCGKTEGLTEEHVVPFALGGNLILPNASCTKCNNITSAFELRVLRGFMGDARVAGEFPTRHPKDRPTTIQIGIKRKGRFEPVSIPASEALGVIQLPKFERAAFLAGKPPVKGINIIGVETIGFGKSPKEVASALRVKALQTTAEIDAFAFVRMLAKIGYSFAVANIGPYPLNEVPLLPLIRGTADDGGTLGGFSRLSTEYRR